MDYAKLYGAMMERNGGCCSEVAGCVQNEFNALFTASETLWNQSMTFDDLTDLMILYLKGKLFKTPDNNMPLEEGTGPSISYLVQMNKRGVLTVRSRPVVTTNSGTYGYIKAWIRKEDKPFFEKLASEYIVTFKPAILPEKEKTSLIESSAVWRFKPDILYNSENRKPHQIDGPELEMMLVESTSKVLDLFRDVLSVSLEIYLNRYEPSFYNYYVNMPSTSIPRGISNVDRRASMYRDDLIVNSVRDGYVSSMDGYVTVRDGHVTARDSYVPSVDGYIQPKRVTNSYAGTSFTPHTSDHSTRSYFAGSQV